MTHIKEVTVEFGATINLGNYENMRLGVQIKADMSEGDIDSGDLNALLEDARKELAFGLWDMADVKLRAVEKWEHEDESERNQGRAINFSNEYRWMVKLHPEMAADMLANVVSDYWEAKRPAVPVVLPELAKQINEGMKAAARSLSAALGVPADVLTGDETPPNGLREAWEAAGKPSAEVVDAAIERYFEPDDTDFDDSDDYDEPEDGEIPPPDPLPASPTYYMPWRGAFHPDGFDDDDEPEDAKAIVDGVVPAEVLRDEVARADEIIAEALGDDLDDEPEDEPEEGSPF